MNPQVQRLRRDPRFRQRMGAAGSLACNVGYALYHGALGLVMQSWWFLAMAAYYVILASTRFAAVLCEVRGASPDMERFVKRIVGALLMLLGIALASVNYLSLREQIATQYGTIPMIAIATYTFTKLTLAIRRAVRQRHDPSPLMAAIRCIGYADVAASVLTLQRSMLVSFEGMAAAEIVIMNAATGGAAFAFIFLLGAVLLRNRKGETNGKV